ncbi:type III secretion system rspB [Pseudomonas sp. KBW05]|nr:type III secretion system rspB [Pseudomonas sp. KBW05]
MHKYTTHFSTTLLTSHVLVKTIGKTAQCIDKICNLQ